jgi:ComF family protein
MVNKLLSPVLQGLFPNYCCLCQWRCPGALPLCAACRSELPANPQACCRCALPLASASASLCAACLQSPPAFDRVIAPWLYGEYVAHLLQRWKFHGDRRLTPLLADLWLQQVSDAPEVDAVLPVPLHWLRHWRRGYNQAELLALALQQQWPQLTLNTSLLRRHKFTRAQSGMNADERSRNLRAAFTASDACANLRLAVVDDVLTTGATANEAAKTLKHAGAAHVEIWCLARTPSPGD